LQHVLSLAKACCTAAADLHRVGFVHRDFRLPNVVRAERDEGSYVIIDMEHAGWSGLKWKLDLLKEWEKGCTLTQVALLWLMISTVMDGSLRSQVPAGLTLYINLLGSCSISNNVHSASVCGALHSPMYCLLPMGAELIGDVADRMGAMTSTRMSTR